MRKQAAWLAIVMFLSGASSAESILGEHLKAIDEAQIQGTFRCAQSVRPDVVLAYELHPGAAPMSMVNRLTIQGDAFGNADLNRINAAVGQRGIESITVTCSSSEVQIVFQVFDPDNAQVDHIFVNKRKNAFLKVSP